MLLFFQEVPGCSTCQAFGRGPLSHPLLVDAIEHEFVPLFVQNNRPGRDAQETLLERVKAKGGAPLGLEPPRKASELWAYRAELEKRPGN